jgi:transcriptional regulator with XRE-family HTH domain
MTAVISFKRESQLGFKARKLRIAEHLTQQKLAEMAGVTREAVDLFEHNLPLPLDNKRRILRELWAKKQEVTLMASLPVANLKH